MEKKKLNTLIMLSALMKFFEKRQELWAQNIPLAEAINQTKVLVEEVEHLEETLSKNKEGLATQKDNDKNYLIEVLFEVISVLGAYASKSGDDTLQEQISYPLSKLQTMRDAALASVASSILTILKQKADVLVPFNLSENERNAFADAIANYKSSLAGMRSNVNVRKRANEKTAELLKKAMKITKEQTKKLMVPYKKTNLDFYKTFVSTSKIVPYGTRYNKDDENPDTESKEPEK